MTKSFGECLTDLSFIFKLTEWILCLVSLLTLSICYGALGRVYFLLFGCVWSWFHIALILMVFIILDSLCDLYDTIITGIGAGWTIIFSVWVLIVHLSDHDSSDSKLTYSEQCEDSGFTKLISIGCSLAAGIVMLADLIFAVKRQLEE